MLQAYDKSIDVNHTPAKRASDRSRHASVDGSRSVDRKVRRSASRDVACDKFVPIVKNIRIERRVCGLYEDARGERLNRTTDSFVHFKKQELPNLGPDRAGSVDRKRIYDKMANTEKDKVRLFLEHTRNQQLLTTLEKENQQLKTRLVQRLEEQDRVAQCLKNVTVDLYQSDLSRIPISNIEGTITLAYKNRIEKYKKDLARLEEEPSDTSKDKYQELISTLYMNKTTSRIGSMGHMPSPQRHNPLSMTNLSSSPMKPPAKPTINIDKSKDTQKNSLDQTQDLTVTFNSLGMTQQTKTTLDIITQNRTIGIMLSRVDQLNIDIAEKTNLIKVLQTPSHNEQVVQPPPADISLTTSDNMPDFDIDDLMATSAGLRNKVNDAEVERYLIMIEIQKIMKNIVKRRFSTEKYQSILAEKTGVYDELMLNLNIKDESELFHLNSLKLVSLYCRDVKSQEDQLERERKDRDEKERKLDQISKEIKTLSYGQKLQRQTAGVGLDKP